MTKIVIEKFLHIIARPDLSRNGMIGVLVFQTASPIQFGGKGNWFKEKGKTLYPHHDKVAEDVEGMIMDLRVRSQEYPSSPEPTASVSGERKRTMPWL